MGWHSGTMRDWIDKFGSIFMTHDNLNGECDGESDGKLITVPRSAKTMERLWSATFSDPDRHWLQQGVWYWKNMPVNIMVNVVNVGNKVNVLHIEVPGWFKQSNGLSFRFPSMRIPLRTTLGFFINPGNWKFSQMKPANLWLLQKWGRLKVMGVSSADRRNIFELTGG